MGISRDLTLILVAALLGGALARRLRLPLVLGYIMAGVLVGPHTRGPTVIEIEEIELLADVGVALLLLTLGIEFPLGRLAPVRPIALLGTPLQILLTALAGSLIGRYLEWPWTQAVWFGSLVSLSSTAVVLKLLLERKVMDTLSSRIMVGMLLVQDLAAIPMAAVLPALGTGGGVFDIAPAVLRAALFIGFMVLLGSRILPVVLEKIARWNSRELFLISVVAIGLGVGYVTSLFGLSMAVGAFIAGMVLSGSPYTHQALAEVSPLRDVFLMVFFVSVGMLLDLSFLVERWLIVLLVTVLVLAVKALILSGITRSFGYTNIAPLAVGLTMPQVGEFSFVLGRVGINLGGLQPEVFSVVLAAAVVTMMLTPMVSGLTKPVYDLWRKRFPAAVRSTAGLREEGLSDHVVIGGFGRVGRLLGHLLGETGQPFVVVEIEYDRVKAAEERGYRSIYGDVSAVPVLEAAGATRARLVILTLTDPVTVLTCISNLRALSPGTRAVVRVVDRDQIGDLAALGVSETVQPEMEAALELGRQALISAGYTDLDVMPFLNRIRLEHYSPMIGDYCQLDGFPGLLTRGYSVDWAEVSEGSPLAGRTIREAGVREKTGVSILAVIRRDGPVVNPSPDHRIQAGDSIWFMGKPEQRAVFKALSSGSGETP